MQESIHIHVSFKNCWNFGIPSSKTKVENGPLEDAFPMKMEIIHSHVSLPEKKLFFAQVHVAEFNYIWISSFHFLTDPQKKKKKTILPNIFPPTK